MGQEGHLALFRHVVESCQSVCPTGWMSVRRGNEGRSKEFMVEAEERRIFHRVQIRAEKGSGW